MRHYPSLASCALVALVALSCGGGDAPAPSEEPGAEESGAADDGEVANAAPLIESIELEPRTPHTGESIAAVIKARDPDGDSLEIVVDWYRNGQLEEEGGSERLDTTGYRRGEQVHAVVHVRDGREEVQQTSGDVRITNTLPRVVSLQFFPPNPTASDTLLVEAHAADSDGDSFELRYRWSVNGKVLEDAVTSSLAPGRMKRGDELEVAVAAADDDGPGEWYVAAPLKLGNGVPKITSAPGRTLATATRYEYAIQASDPDGDKPLRYRLVKGPAGMQVDLVSGVVAWEVPETADGKFEIEVAVSDAYGGESSQNYTLEFHWQSGNGAAPAAPAEGQPESAPAPEREAEPEAEPSEQPER